MSTVWIKHPGTEGVAEVPADALPIYRQSGWVVLSDEDKAAREQAARDEQARAEDRIQKLAGQALGTEPATAPESLPAARNKKKESG